MRGVWVVGLLAGVGGGQVPAPAVVHAAYPAGVGTAVGEQIAGLLADPGAARAHWGIAVTAMDGTPIWGLEEGKLFRPASNAKLFTTAAAMALLGPETRVTTVVSADAPPDADGVIQGDIVLHGAGDANLSGRVIPYELPEVQRARLAREKAVETSAESSPDDRRGSRVPDELKPMEDLAVQVAKAGVKSLTGRVLGDVSLWSGPGYAESWDAGDAVWGYGAAVSALEFNDGQMEVRVVPGARVGDAAKIQVTPEFRDFTPRSIVTTVATAMEANVAIDRRDFPLLSMVYGTVALGRTDTEEIAVQNPAMFAIEALELRLLAHGIKNEIGAGVNTPPRASTVGMQRQVNEPVDLTFRAESFTSPVCGREFFCGVVLAKRESPTVAEDVTVTLKASQNLHAEMLLHRLGKAYGREGSFEQGVRVMRQWLTHAAGLDGEDFFFYDGSGLSSHDLVTPRATARLLAYAATQPWFSAWKAGLPVSGVDGTLGGRFKDGALKGKVFAKTGTLGESRALSGYVECASGKTVIFSVMADDHAPWGSTDRAVMDKVVAAIAAEN